MLNLRLKYLDWDSQQLGIGCGLIDATEFKNLPEPDSLIDWIREITEGKKDIKFITIKLPCHWTGTVNALVKNRALLIDAELTFVYAKGTKKNSNDIPNNCRLEFCKEVDSRAFLPLAEEMRFSRFFLDSNISDDKAIHLWERSIKNHCEGFADRLLVAYFDDEPSGIVTLKFEDSEQLFLHIVGVLKRYQGKKIGKLMLNRITQRYGKKYSIYVETQSINIQAQKVYQKSGFRYHTLKYVLHFWRS